MSEVAPPPEQTELPEAYKPFVPLLEQLSPALAEVLKGQLAQFEVFSRRLEVMEHAQQGEFEGLSGLTNHGAIDHILQSELLLQEEAPLEFLRRLAEAETLFHDRQFADPGAKQVWRVMVSMGPEVMGHARLIALAAIFFLARVAERRGGRFEWCFLPTTGEFTWFKGITVNAIKRFLRSASYRDASARDIAEARALWDANDDQKDARDRPPHADWLIGSGCDWNGQRPALLDEPNSLSFVLAPHIRGEERQAIITVRKAHHENGQAEISLVDDKQCLSALERPFPIPKKAEKKKKSFASAPEPEGWEQRYLATPSGNHRIIRMASGLLVQRAGHYQGKSWHWYVPLTDDLQVLGLEIENDLLKLVLLRPWEGKHRLLFQVFQLKEHHANRQGSLISYRVAAPEGLIRDDKYALPTMIDNGYQMGGHVDIFGSSGARFRVGRRGSITMPSAPPVLLSRGQHHVVQNDISSGTLLQVHRRKSPEELVRRFHLNESVPAKGFSELFWSPTTSTLGYSINRGEWTAIASGGQHSTAVDDGLEFSTEPDERLLSLSFKKNEVHAVLWSDARYGGEGIVEFVRFQNGTKVRTQMPIDLGKDADTIVQILEANSKVLALAADEEGAPERLITINKKQTNAKRQSGEIWLSETAEKAPQLEVRKAK